MLTTDLEPTDGTIFINENNKNYTDALSNKKKYWSHIGYCPQFDALYDELTPSDHIRLFARIKGVRTKYETTLCESLLKRLDLLQYSDKPGGQLYLYFYNKIQCYKKNIIFENSRIIESGQ
jgi:ABC-type multidrug transport system ATPase subunit